MTNRINKETTNGVDVSLTTQIVSAYVSNNPVPAKDIAELIEHVHFSMKALKKPLAEVAEPAKPAVNRRKSLQDNHLVCLEDGLRFTSLKRHLMASHGLTPQEYRDKWNLPGDYPMVAPTYARARSRMAKEVGLGRKNKDG